VSGSAGRVELREVTEADLPTFYQHQRDELGYRMVGFEPRDWDAFMAHWSKTMADPDILIRAVVVDGGLAGNMVCFDQDGEREVGYWLGREFWGRGVATAALTQFLDEIIERPLYAVVAVHNVGSIRVLQKCGFVLTEQEPMYSTAGGPVVEEVRLRLDG
jgi:RimJ/RimL family protein N-acetyltransferase